MPSYRYPGARPFEEDDKNLFFGREAAKKNLLTFTNVEQFVVLFSESGLGKSSIVNAAIIPELRNKNYQIINIRFNSYKNIERNQNNIYALSSPAEKVLSEIKSKNNELTFLDELMPGKKDSLWHEFKRMQILNDNKKKYFIFFDQFEELFSYPREQINIFKDQLSELLYTLIPQEYLNEISKRQENKNAKVFSEKQLDLLYEKIPLKVVVTIRSDKFSFLNGLKDALPGIVTNTFELKYLTRTEAIAAIETPASIEGDFFSNTFEYADDVIEKMLNYLSDEEEIESFQLQILCRYIEEKVIQRKKENKELKKITVNELSNIENIFEDYYNILINNIDSNPQTIESIRKLVEEGLIFEKDKIRLSLYKVQIESMYNIDEKILQKLIDTHLIRSEIDRKRREKFELSHDSLIEPILKAKEKRLAKTYNDISQQTINDLLQKIQDKEAAILTKSEEEKHLINEKDLSKSSRSIRTLNENPSKSDSSTLVKEDNDLYDLYRKLSDAYIVIKDKKNAIDILEKYIQSPGSISKKANAYKDIGNIYLDDGELDNAKNQYLLALKINPNYANAIFNLGLVEEQLGDWDAAIKHYEKVISFNPNDEEALNRVGEIYFDRKDYSKAREISKKLIVLNPKNGYSYFNLGLTEEFLKDLDAAILNYNKALEFIPNYEDALIARARVYFDQKKLSDAEKDYLKLVAINPNNEYYYHSLGIIQENLKNLDSAISNYQKATELNQNYEAAYIDLAAVYFDQTKYEEAKRLYTKLISLNQKNELGYYGLGLIEERLSNYDAALGNYEKAIALNPNYKDALIGTAWIYFDKKEYNKSKEIYEKLLLTDPKNEQYFYHIGLIETNLKNLDSAISNYQKAIELNQNYEAAYIDLAAVYFDQTNYEEAKRLYTKLVSLNPKNELGYYGLGLIEERLNNSDAALENYKKAIELNPNYEDALIATAWIYFDKKEYDKSKEIFEKLLLINPKNEQYYQYLALLENVRKDLHAAITNYINAINLKPENAEYHFNLADLYDEIGETDNAITECELAIKYDPNNSNYHSLLGYIYTRFHNNEFYNKALDEFKKSIELDSNNRYAIAALGACYKRLGNSAAYLERIKIVEQIAPLPSEDEYVQSSIAALCMNKPEALRLLKIAIENQIRSVDFILNDADFDFISDDAEFKKLLGKQ